MRVPTTALSLLCAAFLVSAGIIESDDVDPRQNRLQKFFSSSFDESQAPLDHSNSPFEDGGDTGFNWDDEELDCPKGPGRGRGRRPRPHHPHRPPVLNKTIYQIISEDKRFSRLSKLVDLNEATIDLLNSSSTNITFFAPPNWALPKPRRSHGETDPEDEDFAQQLCSSLVPADVCDAGAPGLSDDEDKEKKERLKHLIGAILSYHTVPAFLDGPSLFANATFGTSLTLHDGSLDGEPLRLRFHARPPLSPILNGGTRILPPVIASNGILYIVDRPVLPPPSVLQGLFSVSEHFSILTSALQRVNLSDTVEWRHPHDLSFVSPRGSPAVTLFAPSNVAFFRLPPRLRHFLFSPLGERALKKLLQLHIAPNFVLHSDYVHNATEASNYEWSDAWGPAVDVDEIMTASEWLLDENPEEPDRLSLHDDSDGVNEAGVWAWMRQLRQIWSPPAETADGASREPGSRRPPRHRHGEPRRPPPGGPRRRPHRPPPPREVSSSNITLPTALVNHTLTIDVKTLSFKPPFGHGPPLIVRTVAVNGLPVFSADWPARNGAVHVINRLIHPFRRHKADPRLTESEVAPFNTATDEEEDGMWDDWEDWLTSWAMEQTPGTT